MSGQAAETDQVVPGHATFSFDLGSPRQYTARGGWNAACECGALVGESGDDDLEERWQRHLADVLLPGQASAGDE